MRMCFAIALFLLAGVPRGFAATTAEQRFAWDEANARMSTARTERDFLLAARGYAKLVNAGVRNGPLFYNLGTALLKGRQHDQALAALLRAERFMGSNPETRRNIALALARDDKNAEVSLPWRRFFLFWHYGLGLRTRIAVAVTAFAVFWLALTIRLLGARRLAQPPLVLALLAVVLFGSSVATSLNQEVNALPVTVNPDAASLLPAKPGKTAAPAPAGPQRKEMQ
ncbi:MAG: hypothetical protein QME60_07260 [Verrucomicrobiota bacterium]|nr:hypothetical protein [Verrucomicrobiota bacterium]